MFGGHVFQQTVSIPMGTNCPLLLADLFLYSYKEDFMKWLLKKKRKVASLTLSFYFSYIHVDDVYSLINSKFGDFVDHIYLIELEIKNTTDTASCISYLEIDTESRLRTKPYNKRDGFNFPIVNFPLICSNFPAAP